MKPAVPGSLRIGNNKTRDRFMWGSIRSMKPLIIALLALVLGACAHTGGNTGEKNVDPWEPFNRKVFDFNEGLDRAVIKPVATGYKKVVPGPVRKGVGNFFLNLTEPTTIVNDVLQGKVNQGVADLVRFVFNSSFGLLGVFDIATPMGLERHEEDFGQTFSVWGFDRGPYLVLPLLGPSTVTDTAGIIPATYLTDLRTYPGNTPETYVLLSANVIDTRARLLGASKVVELQLDPYIFRREAYLQRREQLIHDGDPPLEDDWE